MTRTRSRIAWIAALAWMVLGIAYARGDGRSPASSGTGDAWVDSALLDIDRYAARYPDAFADELARYHGAPRELVGRLLSEGRWSAGDVYFACVLGQFAGQPCRGVVLARDRDRAQDWKATARGFGVAPDSEAFHRIKRAIVFSYGRWARPLSVDASLHAEFPQHRVVPAATQDADRDHGAHTPVHPRKAGA